MKTISLTQGKVALVDDADYERINCFKWYAQKDDHRYYAVRSIQISKSKQGMIRMHRVILDAPDGTQIDHINNNGLDNRKSSLRFCTCSQNIMHQRIKSNNKLGLKGVSIDKRNVNKRFRAQIRVNNKNIQIGLYPTAQAAAQAYDIAAMKYHGKFAWLNNNRRKE